MKQIISIFAVVALLVGAVHAQAKQPVRSPVTDVRPVETQVRKLWEAFKKRDKATLSSLIDEQFRMFEEGSSTFGDKKAEVDGPDEYELLNYTLSDFNVKAVGRNSALVTYRADYEGKSGGEVLKGKSIFGETWVYSGGNWKVLYLQETYVK